MEHLHRVVGPIATNVHVLADERSREAIAIDTATPSLAWIADQLAARLDAQADRLDPRPLGSHRRQRRRGRHTGADIAVHPADRGRLEHPEPVWAPFEIVPSVPAVELAEGGDDPLRRDPTAGAPHPGHTEGSVCLFAADDGLLYSGDTLFAAGWRRVDLPGGDPEAMVASIGRLTELADGVGVFPGHGQATTIGRERAWMRARPDGGRLFA